MFDTAAIAAAHGIAAETLSRSLAARGWDFSRLDASRAAHAEFAAGVAEDAAREIAAREAARRATAAEIAARRLAEQTPEARANPAMACSRCDGKGQVRGFEHIERGVCFGCGGSGVWRPRRASHAA